MRPLSRRLPVKVVTSVVALLIATAVAGTQMLAKDERLEQCMASGENVVRETLDIRSAADYRKLLPRMGDSPELDTAAGAAFVVIFQDPFRIGTIQSLPATGDSPDTTVGEVEPTEFKGVVCILVGDTPFLYADVDTSEIDRSFAIE